MTSAARAHDGPPPREAERRTNRSPRRRRGRSARLTAGIAAILLLALGAYTAAAALLPLAPLAPAVGQDAERTITAGDSRAEAVVAAAAQPTAIGWEDGPIWSNDTGRHPIASITKLVTVLVCLEEQPLGPDEDGPAFSYGAAEQQREATLRAQDAIMHPVPVGTRFSTRQVLELILLPSANDYAIAYANRVFGDNAAFVRAAEAWAAANGLRSLRIVEPSGLDERNRASAADLVRLARIALRNETVRAITGMASAEIPVVGRIESTNPLFGTTSGILGFKTGSTAAAGYNLLAGRASRAGGRATIAISATLARPSPEARAADGAEILAGMAGLPTRRTFVAADDEVGSLTSWQGERVPLVAAGRSRGVLLPGERAERRVALDPQQGVVPEGTEVGRIVIDAPSGDAEVPVVTAEPIAEPDLWWRLGHPAIVFGWEAPQAV